MEAGFTPLRGLGLALSGGAARGIAHLGVLEALDELQLPIARLSGVSSGGLAAVFYAAGIPPREVLRLLTDTRFLRLLRPAFGRGLVRVSMLERLIAAHLPGNQTFADLRLPVTLAATDLAAGETVYFDEGPLTPALLATSAVPVLFQPVEYQGRVLVDGGLLNNLPVEPLLSRPGVAVVGVHTNVLNPEAPITSLRHVAERTFFLAIGTNVVARLARCELVLQPPELRRFSVMDLRHAAELFDIGYRYTLSRAAALRDLLEKPAPAADFG
ncbi:patatin-like phospholipase family protein [Hymenobacter sp. B81]|uniref:patatin-like phospholipase family protein n=1 Tax=Hymenobacter sp. B81 TaxID=3344878 RepID=UPI0037DC5505